MENKEVLIILDKLETFRKKLASGEISEGCADWTVRTCQAIVAEDSFKNRVEWTEELRNTINV